MATIADTIDSENAPNFIPIESRPLNQIIRLSITPKTKGTSTIMTPHEVASVLQ